MNCNRCGKKIEPGAAFCSGCGNAVNRGISARDFEEPGAEDIFARLFRKPGAEKISALDFGEPEEEDISALDFGEPEESVFCSGCGNEVNSGPCEQFDSDISDINNFGKYENADVLFKGKTADHKQIENIINKWLSKQPGSPIRNITSFLSFESAVEYPVFSSISNFEIKKRKLSPFSGPYRGESLLKNVFVPTDKDLWKFESVSEEEFERIIRASLTKNVCSLCHGNGKITCPECYRGACPQCHGRGSVTCSECEGTGDIYRRQSVRRTCPRCDGRGFCYDELCKRCHGKGCYYTDEEVLEICIRCRGTGRVTCSYCGGDRNFTCKECHGSEIVRCSQCEGTGSMIEGYTLIQQNFSESYCTVWSPQQNFPAVLLEKEMLNSMGKITKTIDSPCFCNSIPDDFSPEYTLAAQNLLQIVRNNMSKKDNFRITKHKFEIREITFIRYEGIEKSSGKHYTFWVNPENDFVIYQGGFEKLKGDFEELKRDILTRDNRGKSLTWLVLSILATLFFCIPLGIVSIWYACKAISALNYGNLDEAKANNDKARLFCLLSIGIGIGLMILCILDS